MTKPTLITIVLLTVLAIAADHWVCWIAGATRMAVE